MLTGVQGRVAFAHKAANGRNSGRGKCCMFIGVGLAISLGF
jgi:hypothetical protein